MKCRANCGKIKLKTGFPQYILLIYKLKTKKNFFQKNQDFCKNDKGPPLVDPKNPSLILWTNSCSEFGYNLN